MQMTKTNYGTTNDGCKRILTTEGRTSCGIEYELKAITDIEDMLQEAYLDITTPAAFIIVLQNLTDEQIDELVGRLNSTYSYKQGDCVSLKIPGSRYDCIFINSSVSKEHPLGYNIVEKEYGTVDGHEIEVCDVLIEYVENIRTTDDPSDHDNYVGFSIIYDTEIVPDDNCADIIKSCNKVERDWSPNKVSELELRMVGMEDDLFKTEFYVRRGFSHEDITFTFRHMKEEQRHMTTNNVV